MFTDRDFLSYFTEIEMLERNMRDIYLETMNQIKDRQIKSIFEKLYAQETEHQNILDEMRKIVIRKLVPHGDK